MRLASLFLQVVAAVLVPATAHAQAMPAAVTQTDEQSVLATEDENDAAEVSRDEAALRRFVSRLSSAPHNCGSRRQARKPP